MHEKARLTAEARKVHLTAETMTRTYRTGRMVLQAMRETGERTERDKERESGRVREKRDMERETETIERKGDERERERESERGRGRESV